MRFWEKIQPTESCWLWTGHKNENGYGVIDTGRHSTNRHVVKATRVMLSLLGVDITGRGVLHHCDNPACVNPFHLYLGDQHRNSLDMVKRGRRIYKLTAEDVLELRHASKL